MVQCQETDENEITFRGDMQSKMAALQVSLGALGKQLSFHSLYHTGGADECFGSAGQRACFTDCKVSIISVRFTCMYVCVHSECKVRNSINLTMFTVYSDYTPSLVQGQDEAAGNGGHSGEGERVSLSLVHT